MFDVHVVGAGPAGLISAITAAREGKKALVSEEHGRIGIPVNCSGLFSKTGLESLSGFLDYKDTVISWYDGATLDFAGEKVSVKSGKPTAYSCRRSDFDAMLAESAEKEGAVIELNRRVTRHFQSGCIIGADGPNSSVARFFDFPAIERFAVTMHGTVEYRAEDIHSVELFFSNEKYPGFFGWIIPHDEYTAEAGVGVSAPNNIKTAFDTFLKDRMLNGPGETASAVIPLKARKTTGLSMDGKNIVLVGDAAGQTKSTTGGGVIFGGNCASLAGALFDFPERYESEWRKKFGADLTVHSLIRSHLDSLDEAGIRRLGAYLKKLRMGDYLSNNGHMDMPTKMLGVDLLKHLLRIPF